MRSYNLNKTENQLKVKEIKKQVKNNYLKFWVQ